MMTLTRTLAQFAIYVGFAGLVAYFSSAPAYQVLEPQAGLVKLSFSHAAARREPCHRLTPEELAELAPNMRRSESCKRERIDLYIELKLDGEVVYAEMIAPSGLARDGEASVYEKFIVPPGTHAFDISMRDTVRTSGSDYSAQHITEIKPGQLLVIDFDDTSGGFSFR